MEKIPNLFPQEIIEAFGWMIFHSVWQAGVIAIILVILMVALKKFSPGIRYTIAYLALAATLIWACGTWYSTYTEAKEKTKIREAVLSSPEQIAHLIAENINQIKVPVSEKQAINKIKMAKTKAFLQKNFIIIFYLWALGVLIFLIRMSGSLIYLTGLKRRNTFLPDTEWLKRTESFSNKLRIRKKVEILQSAMVKIPMVLGYFKPVILVPLSLMSGMEPKEIEAIIAHELAHIKRNDYFLNIVQSIIETLFFYHPAVWLISRIIRNEREHSCDDLAVKLTADKPGYIRALAAAVNFQNTNQNYAVAFPGKEGGLLHRIKRIQNTRSMKKNVNEGFLAASLIFISLILLSFTFESKNLKDENFFKPAEKTNKIVTDTTKNKVTTVKVIKIKHDSLDQDVLKATRHLETLPDDMERLIEIAYTYNDQALADSIRESIRIAMDQVDFEKIRIEVQHDIDEAMANIDVDMMTKDAMKQVQMEMDRAKMEIKLDTEKVKKAQAEIEKVNVDSIVSAAMKEAEKAMKDINIDVIVNQSVDAAMEALDNLNIEVIIEDALENAQEIMESHSNDYEYKYEYNYDSDSSECSNKKVIIRKETDNDDADAPDNSKSLEEKLKELEE